MLGSNSGNVATIAWQLALVVACIVAVAAFSSSEAALISVSKLRLRSLAEKGNRAAQSAMRLVTTHDRLFATILFTENAFVILASSVGTALALRLIGAGGEYVATLIMTIVLVTFGEITPKTYAASHSEAWALRMGPFMEAVTKIMTVPVWLLTRATNFLVATLTRRRSERPPLVTTDELRMLIDIGEAEGTVRQPLGRMLQNVLEFGQRKVNEVMTPRPEIVAVQQDTPLESLLRTFADSKHARFPVYGGDLDEVVGFVSVKDVLMALSQDSSAIHRPVKGIMRQAMLVPESKRVGTLFSEMRAQKVQLAVVIDEYGGTAGLVTLEELMEEIVGRVSDELVQQEPPIRRVAEGRVRVDASLRVDEINEELGLYLPESDLYETVAGLILLQLGHVPREGETCKAGTAELTVERMKGPKIEEVMITVSPPQRTGA